MKSTVNMIHSDPDILGGAPVFADTRVPVQSRCDYLEGQHTIDDFLGVFPTVTREQAITALEQAKDLLVINARAA